jgi:hypothetical protein
VRFALLAVFTSFAIGCSQPAPPTAKTSPDDDRDHSQDVPITKSDVKMPATFDELVSRIEGYNRQIKTAIDAGKPESGHRALDELEIVLAETMTLAQNAVPEERLAIVNDARQTIRNAFRELHQSIDAKEVPDYAAKEKAIQNAISTLKQAKESTKEN